MPKTPAPSSQSPEPRKGTPIPELDEQEFKSRYNKQFKDPAFESHREAIAKLGGIAWQAYADSRKSPVTRKAGPEFADKEYDLSEDWLAARDAVNAARTLAEAAKEKGAGHPLAADSRLEAPRNK